MEDEKPKIVKKRSWTLKLLKKRILRRLKYKFRLMSKEFSYVQHPTFVLEKTLIAPNQLYHQYIRKKSCIRRLNDNCYIILGTHGT